MGQVDIVCIKNKKIFIIEAKRNNSVLSRPQYGRLVRSLEFLSCILDFPIHLKVCTSKDLPKKDKLINLLK
tara:strand:- start:40888 stop:41100 length:213 start_codon:yes stop_codon:yes gene_type:complete